MPLRPDLKPIKNVLRNVKNCLSQMLPFSLPVLKQSSKEERMSRLFEALYRCKLVKANHKRFTSVTAFIVLTNTRKMDHSTLFLTSLHWLPVCPRLDFKIFPLIQKSLNDLGKNYIYWLLIKYEPCTPLFRHVLSAYKVSPKK